MKVAVLAVRFPSGWKAVAGEDPAALKAEFRSIKDRGSLMDPETKECADLVYFFDTAGALARKFLAAPETVAAIAESKQRATVEATTKEHARAEQAAATEGRAQAVAVAEKAVAVIATEIARLGAAAPAPEPVAPAPKPVAAAPAPVPEPVAPAPETSEEQDPTAARFGASRPAKAARK